jgi:probable rRNA maturation factor
MGPNSHRGGARPGPEIVVGSKRVGLPLPAARVRRVVTAVLRGEARATRRVAGIHITFLGPTAMRRLNREWKGHDLVTDVLSFALESPAGGVTGDVYICAAMARSSARAHAVPMREELVRLVVHGTLHVLGHDHPEGPGRTRSTMWRRQERYVKALT